MRTVALLVAAGLTACGPSAAEKEAARVRALAVAEVNEGTALIAWQTARVACEVIRQRAMAGQQTFSDAERAPCLAREAKREEYLKACVAVRADQTACELRAQREERNPY